MDEYIAICNAILEKGHRLPASALTQEERIVFQAYSFLVELEMGGASGALYNLSPIQGTDQHEWSDLRLAAGSVAAIGDRETAALCLQAAEALERLPEPLPETWEELEEAASTSLPANFQDMLESRVHALYNFLETYTNEHLS